MNDAKMTIHYFMLGLPFGTLSTNSKWIEHFNVFNSWIVHLDDKWLNVYEKEHIIPKDIIYKELENDYPELTPNDLAFLINYTVKRTNEIQKEK